MPDRFYVDTSGIDDLARKLSRAAEHARPEVDRELFLIADEHAGVAQAIAREHSKSIPPTIHARPLPGAAEVVASGALANVWEHGNKDRTRAAPMFIHPVFAKKGDPRYDDRSKWREQKRYRFFEMARRRLSRRTTERLIAAWGRALASAGIRTE